MNYCFNTFYIFDNKIAALCDLKMKLHLLNNIEMN